MARMARIPNNPFLSLWLSAANRMANKSRGWALSAAQGQQAAMSAAAAAEGRNIWARALRDLAKSNRLKRS